MLQHLFFYSLGYCCNVPGISLPNHHSSNATYLCVTTVEACDVSQLGFYLSSGISADQVRTF